MEPHLADQIIPYLALARGESRFTVSRITKHLLTNAWVVRQFLPAKIEIRGQVGRRGEVRVKGGNLVKRLRRPPSRSGAH
jgi:RNA 3'-terminal phosphate cyclase